MQNQNDLTKKNNTKQNKTVLLLSNLIENNNIQFPKDLCSKHKEKKINK